MKTQRRNPATIRVLQFAAIAVAIGWGLQLVVGQSSPVPKGKPATYPAWWFQQGVIAPTDSDNPRPTHPEDYLPANDFAVLTQGQLRKLAFAASAEIRAHLFYAGTWNYVGSGSRGYAAVNQGQLKNVASFFIDRLKLNGIYYRNDYAYPWVSEPAHADYALATIGQAKNLFNFDLTTDTDGDGIPDWWEARHGLNKNDPSDARRLSNGGRYSNYVCYRYNIDPNSTSQPATLPPLPAFGASASYPVILQIITTKVEQSALPLLNPGSLNAVPNGDFEAGVPPSDIQDPNNPPIQLSRRNWYPGGIMPNYTKLPQGGYGVNDYVYWEAVGGYAGANGNRATPLQIEIQNLISDRRLPSPNPLNPNATRASRYAELDAHWERLNTDGSPVYNPNADPPVLDTTTEGLSDTTQDSDHGIRQTIFLKRGLHQLVFDYRGRPGADSDKFSVSLQSEGYTPVDQWNILHAQSASSAQWKRAYCQLNISGGDPALSLLPFVLTFDLALDDPGTTANSYGVFIDNVILVEGTPYGNDTDGDGLTDEYEAWMGLDPFKKDNPAVQLRVKGYTTP